LLAKSYPIVAEVDGVGSAATSSFYVDFVSRDLGKIVELVVPEGRQGLPNLLSTKQILESWRSKRVIDPQKVDQVMSALASRHPTTSVDTIESLTASPSRLSRNEIFKRIEEDRERHKRLRERRWVQPVSRTSHHQLPPLASFLPFGDQNTDDGEHQELPIDIEFENEWETTSNWNEDDDEAGVAENKLCFLLNDPADEISNQAGSAPARYFSMDVS